MNMETKRNIIFFDDTETRRHLLPLTYTRPACHLRVGITTIEQKWRALLGDGHRYSYLTASYLKVKYPTVARSHNLMVAGHVVPTPALAAQVLALRHGDALLASDGTLVAFNGAASEFDNRTWSREVVAGDVLAITRTYHIFENNAAVLQQDFEALTAGRQSAPLPPSTTLIGPADRLFLEPDAVVDGATLNTREGCIYIGRDVEVMEGACVRGPFAALDHSKVRIGAKVYGATTLGPHCKIGGEVENCVFIGYSNKAHEGFLGDAVIGQWCNIGGGTTASNLKNDYSMIKMWDYAAQRFMPTGLQFCGLMMGDHSKIGVNCMINTATVIGVGVELHGSGFPRNFVASFQTGSPAGYHTVALPAFFAMAERVMARRGIALTDVDRDIFTAIYNLSDRYR